MVEISNIDAIIELILREARAMRKLDLFDAIVKVHDQVWAKTYPILRNLAYEERRKKDDENRH